MYFVGIIIKRNGCAMSGRGLAAPIKSKDDINSHRIMLNALFHRIPRQNILIGD